jgi:endonuclease YncB( thermonuclease family)
MFIVGRSFAAPARANVVLLAAACFAAGLTAGVWFAPGALSGGAAPAITQAVLAPAQLTQVSPPAGLRSAHPAEVLRILDGDTFEARVRVWPGMDVTTKIRLRGIDAAELHARCDDERVKALAARDALTRILAQGGVGVSHIGQDKSGGRVDADVSTAGTPDVSAAMLSGGFARPYSGGKRDSWCG